MWLLITQLLISCPFHIHTHSYDCDEFTKEFYRVNFNIVDFTPIQVKQLAPPSIKQVSHSPLTSSPNDYFSPLKEIPPYNGFGSLEDSKQSCLSLIPQPPKKDFIKMLENDGKVLRFSAVMVSYCMASR